MTDSTMVELTCELALGGWRARLRPAGPAGQLTIGLAGGITVWLDRAEPQLVLEVAAYGPSASAAGLSVLAILYGPEVAALAADERSGQARYHPEPGERGAALLALLAGLGAIEDYGTLVAIDLARLAERLARAVRATDPLLARLLDQTAMSEAARGVSALRLLPQRTELQLSTVAARALDQALDTVADLMGAELGLGPVVERLDLQSQLATEADPASAGGDLLFALAAAGAGGGQARTGEQLLGHGPTSWQLDLTDSALPVLISQLYITEVDPGTYQLSAPVSFAEYLDGDVLSSLTTVDPRTAPAMWARVVRAGDAAVLYAAQCLITDGELSATVLVKPEYRYREQFWIDLCADISAPVRTPFERRADLAERQGILAVRRQRQANRPQQWESVAELWLRCAQLWARAGDLERQALAAAHAVRAYHSAGQPTRAAELANRARLLLSRVDDRWLAPDLAQRAIADPLELSAQLRLALLGAPVTDWVISQLEQTVLAAVPTMHDSYLAALLELTGRADDPAYGRIRRLRARARVAIAFYASGFPDTIPLASALLAPASVDWPYLDSLGRQRFAAANRQLLAPALDALP